MKGSRATPLERKSTTPWASTHRISMANTPEHLTLTQHRSDIAIALADEVYRLSDELFDRGLISGDNANAAKKF